MSGTKGYENEKILCQDEIQARSIPKQNIIYKLREREMYGGRRGRPGTECHVTRSFYTNIFPNFTISNVNIPGGYLRKFTPDGKFFLIITWDQTALELYKYKGPCAATNFINKSYTYNDNEEYMDTNYETRTNLFQNFFKLKRRIQITYNRLQLLNRECCIFTEDSKYAIVAATIYKRSSSRLLDTDNINEIYRNNESLPILSQTSSTPMYLDDYVIVLVDLIRAQVRSRITFKFDRINLQHNQGIYLYHNTLAILSLQHQTVHIFNIEDGDFTLINKIGRFCYPDDELVLYTALNENNTQPPAHKETTINLLKHRLITFLYNRAKDLSVKTGTPLHIRRFYQYFDIYCNLRIISMQLFDNENILLKYVPEIILLSDKSNENSISSAQQTYLVVYNFKHAKIIQVFENTSSELLSILGNYCDNFRNLHRYTRFTCSPSNNIYSRQSLDRMKSSIVGAKYGGLMEATKRLIGQLPVACNSYCSSPYLDLSLFSYDEKRVSMLERPKPCGEYPIRFYGRDSGILKFKMHAGVVHCVHNLTTNNRRLVSFSFHPTDPFAISVKRNTDTEYIAHFHVRYDPALINKVSQEDTDDSSFNSPPLKRRFISSNTRNDDASTAGSSSSSQ